MSAHTVMHLNVACHPPRLLRRPGRQLQYLAADIGTNPSESGLRRRDSSLAALALRVMTVMRDRGAVAFIGPDDTCGAEALVATAWNLPVISYVSRGWRVAAPFRSSFPPLVRHGRRLSIPPRLSSPSVLSRIFQFAKVLLRRSASAGMRRSVVLTPPPPPLIVPAN